MKSYIFAAAAILGAVANGSVVRRADAGTLPCGATSTTSHDVVQGDTLNALSAQYGAGVCDIASLNGITNPNVINVGQHLTIPLGCTHIDNTTCISPQPDPTATCVPGLGSVYIVRSGDTLTTIAQDYQITLNAVIAANTANIPNPDLIEVGQQVNIPVCPSSQCAIVGTYNIVSGDVFVDLAKKYRTTVGQIKSLNSNVDPTKLAVGQQIILPQGCMNVKSVA